jgi:nucleoside phosphorylase
MNPDIIINAGTAGGFRRKGGEIGDVYISTFMKYHDRRIPIHSFEAYSRGNFEAVKVDNLVKVQYINMLFVLLI